MDNNTLLEKAEEFAEMLDDALPEVDFKHRDELLDIFDLFKARLQMFINNYGSN